MFNGPRTAHGRGTLRPTPSWAPAAGSWGTIPNTRFDTSGAGWAGTSPDSRASGIFTEAMLAWCGAVKVTKGVMYQGVLIPGTFMVIAAGGGHSDYAGNEVYAEGPFEGTPAWLRLTDPTIPGPYNVDHAADGVSPISRHLYDHCQYMPNIGAMGSILLLGACGAFQPGGGTRPVIDLFDLATNTWSAPATSALPGLDFDTNYGACAYNPVTRKVHLAPVNNSQKFYTFDEDTGITTYVPFNCPTFAGNSKACIDSGRNLLLQMRAGGGVQAVDLNAIPSGGGMTVLTTAGTGPNDSLFAMEWMPNRNQAVVWQRNSDALWTLTPPATTDGPTALAGTWTWASLPVAGAMGTNAVGNGIYGRFRYWTAPFGDLVLAITGPDSLTSVYRF